MSAFSIDTSSKLFFSYLYPDIDWSQVEFKTGLPKLFVSKWTTAITLGSWVPGKINVYFKDDPRDSAGGLALIGHELYHVQYILSTSPRIGLGWIRAWFLAYLYCGVLSLGFGREHFMEDIAYSVEDGIREFFLANGFNLEDNISLDSEFFSKFMSKKCEALAIRFPEKSFKKILSSGTERVTVRMFQYLKVRIQELLQKVQANVTADG
jgi:hypothetical protein